MDILSNTPLIPMPHKKGKKSPVSILLKQLFDYKYLFIICITISLVIAFLVNRYTQQVYLVRTSILVNDKGIASQNNDPKTLLYGEKTESDPDKNSLQEEVTILKSLPFVSRTVNALNFRVDYYVKSRLGKIEIYDPLAFTVAFPDSTTIRNLTNQWFKIYFVDKNTFTITEVAQKKTIATNYKVGEPVVIKGCPIIVQTTTAFIPANDVGKEYQIFVNDLYNLALNYKSKLNISASGTEGSVINIYMASTIPQKGIDFLNEFTKQYINYKYEEKGLALSQTLSFINEQLATVKKTLDSSEGRLQTFKTTNTFSDAFKMADRSLESLSKLDEDRATLVINDRYYNSILNSLDQNKNLDQLTAPTSVGIYDGPTDDLVKQLTTLQIEKNNAASGAGSKNPLVADLDSKIATIKKSLRGNISNLASSNRAKLSQNYSRAGQFQAQVYSLPKEEREYVDIKRNNDMNEKMYLFLSQKKIEAGILKSATTYENKVIESAILDSGVPLKPKKTNNYAMAILAGLAIPFGFIWARNAVNKKVSGKNEFQNITSIPFVGTIYHNYDSTPIAITPNSRTAISESFRILRSYITSYDEQNPKKVILLTSMDSNEGKSFSSINIASSLALARKKTVLVNMDLRVHSDIYINLDNAIGISSFLNDEITLDEIIYNTENPYLDYIPAGEIANNSSDLLLENKLQNLIEYLRSNYEYVIIDTPPVGITADPLVIAKYSDLNLIVVRENFTSEERLYDLEQMYKSGKIRNAGIVFNDERIDKKSFKNNYYYNKKAAVKRLSFNPFKP